jgi:hypothetical protein
MPACNSFRNLFYIHTIYTNGHSEFLVIVLWLEKSFNKNWNYALIVPIDCAWGFDLYLQIKKHMYLQSFKGENYISSENTSIFMMKEWYESLDKYKIKYRRWSGIIFWMQRYVYIFGRSCCLVSIFLRQFWIHSLYFQNWRTKSDTRQRFLPFIFTRQSTCVWIQKKSILYVYCRIFVYVYFLAWIQKNYAWIFFVFFYIIYKNTREYKKISCALNFVFVFWNLKTSLGQKFVWWK